MAKFDMDIIRIEGGYSNDPDDLGGETKYGISKRSYPKEDIKNLTIERAVEIYKRDFWNPCKLDKIENQITANIIFRFVVNAGVPRGVRLLQETLNTFVPLIAGVKVDSIVGNQTLYAVGVIRPIRLQDSLRVAICRYYLDVVLLKPVQKKHFQGWISRALM